MRRVVAWIGIVALVAMYVITLIFAILSKDKEFQALFNASLYLTFIIPAVIYVYSMIYKVVHKKDDKDDASKEEKDSGKNN